MKQLTMIQVESKNNIEAFKWVGKALCKDIIREILWHFHVEGGKAVATDGKRIHVATLDVYEAIPDGNYLPIKVGKRFLLQRDTEDRTYPNWRAVVPATDGLTKACGYISAPDNASTMCYAFARHKVSVVYQYVKDALSQGLMEGWVARSTPEINPVVLMSEGKTAVIMPVRNQENSVIEPEVPTCSQPV